ncbi:hypothetical protein NJC38_04405 [Pseudomonas sp. 21LCFQ010]|uniref:hypothetical protein n=1 Tax=Pseudomonas sp. 21LCFQ010 TaxID=2957506 RepID=UPI0020970A08|nr:hypothetical protein [Pseudomonas sp. 21LCFQ010]MCO8161394.1 hypothetical protein [Pseudomonas sp. 21LCFQ010]
MIRIDDRTLPTTHRLTTLAATPEKAASHQDTKMTTNTDGLSDMAQRLSRAALHAAHREQLLSSPQLREHAISTHNEAFQDAPALDLLTFQTNSREHLSLIAYDGSGSFTLHERRIARQEIYARDALTYKILVSDGQKELANDSRLVNTAEKALQHFNSLSAIEQTLYPAGYPERLQEYFEGKPPSQLSTFSIKDLFSAVNSNAVPAAASPPSAIVGQGRSEAGHKLLLARKFGVFEPPVADSSQGATWQNVSLPSINFLTRQDRTLLSQIYAYAHTQSMDLHYVDDLARDLACYRRHNDGQSLFNMNSGHSYDGMGRQLSVKFTPENSVIAQRILSSKALNSTQLDKGFLRFAMEPGYMPYGASCDLRFMEQIMTYFSSAQDTGHSLDQRFGSYPTGGTHNKIVSTSETVRKQSSKPPLAYVHNGVWTITPKGKAAGYALNPTTGQLEQIKPAPKPIEKKTGNLLDGFFDKPGVKRLLPTPFMLLLMKYKLQGRVRRP